MSAAVRTVSIISLPIPMRVNVTIMVLPDGIVTIVVMVRGGTRMAKEYIEREALLKDIEEERPEIWTDSEAERQAENDFYKYRDIVKIQPTADVVEVKHGEWVEIQKYDIFECSECGYEWYMQGIGRTHPFENNANFCPDCGVKMDLKEGADSEM
jgi:hypothetical protein